MIREDMAYKRGKVLVVDDDRDVLLAAELFLKQHVARVDTETNPESIPSLMKEENYDVILLDMNFTKDVTSGQEGFDWLRKILEIDPTASVVLVTAYADYDLAVRAIKAGAFDFASKPWQNEKLLTTVHSALRLRKSRLEVTSLRWRQKQLAADLDQPFADFIGRSAPMQQVFATIAKVAATDASVLITGENGTGKELVARALHRQSARANEAFVRVDMGALTGTLFESELFGHTKGAFTDAREDRAGRFEIASGGTIFLDEISNIPLDLQVKLLTVLQSRQVTRIGSNTSKTVDIRAVCATNTDPARLVEEGRFRQDLLYRINTVEIRVPPLRQRLDDIPLLVDHFLKTYAAKYRRPSLRVAPVALEHLRLYHWPGNVRELQHTVERAVIMSEGNLLGPEDFHLPVAGGDGDHAFTTLNLEQLERAAVERALNKHGGNVTRAAKALGLTRASLYRRIERYGL